MCVPATCHGEAIGKCTLCGISRVCLWLVQRQLGGFHQKTENSDRSRGTRNCMTGSLSSLSAGLDRSVWSPPLRNRTGGARRSRLSLVPKKKQLIPFFFFPPEFFQSKTLQVPQAHRSPHATARTSPSPPLLPQAGVSSEEQGLTLPAPPSTVL